MVVENLEIEITESGGSAGSALTALADTLDRLANSLGRVRPNTKTTSNGLKRVADSAKQATKHSNNLLSSLKRIAMYRMLRSIIKEISKAFKEGLEDSYFFSERISGEGNRFAVAMDSMSTAALTMKNQMGSAFIGLLTAIQPIINTIISLVTMAANAISQLFAAFTGSTYLKANDVTKKFAENTVKGGKAAKEWKNQLLGFDEINRLNDTSSSGGGGTPKVDPTGMFEDTPIDQSILDFVDRIKAAANAGDWEGVGSIVGDKMNELISKLDTAGWAQNLSEKLRGALQIAIGFLETFDSYELGYKIGQFFANIGWAGLAIDVGRLIFNLFKSAVNFALGLLGGIFSGIYEFFKERIEEWQQRLPAETYGVGGAFVMGLLDGIVTGLYNIGSWLWEHIGAPIINSIKNFFGIHSPSTVMAEIGRNIVQGLLDGISERWNTLRSALSDKFNALKSWWQGLSLGSFSFKTPHLTVSYEPVNNLLARFLGVTALPHLSVSWFAKGGVIDGASLIGAGEAGAEAIVPLENNTGWLDMIADRLMEAMGNNNSDRPVDVRVFLDSREIKAGQQRLSRAMGV